MISRVFCAFVDRPDGSESSAPFVSVNRTPFVWPASPESRSGSSRCDIFRSCLAMCAHRTLPSPAPILRTSSSEDRSPRSLTSIQHCSTNFASWALCRCLSSSSNRSPIRTAAFPSMSPSPSSFLSSWWKDSIVRCNSLSRDLMFELCWPSARRTLPESSFSLSSRSSLRVLSRVSACSNVRISGFGSNAWPDWALAEAPGGPKDRRAGAAESESASTKSLTIKSLLLKVSKLKTCAPRTV